MAASIRLDAEHPRLDLVVAPLALARSRARSRTDVASPGDVGRFGAPTTLRVIANVRTPNVARGRHRAARAIAERLETARSARWHVGCSCFVL